VRPLRTKSFSSPVSPKPKRWRSWLIDKGIITQQEFLHKVAEERATYQRILNPIAQ
jgi:hypothetical protein